VGSPNKTSQSHFHDCWEKVTSLLSLKTELSGAWLSDDQAYGRELTGGLRITGGQLRPHAAY
jgi:hypothetical protein